MQVLGDDPPLLVSIEVTNVGHRPISIKGGGLELSSGLTYNHYLLSQSDEMPKTLGDGDALLLNFNYDEVKRYAAELNKQQVRFTKAFIRDSEGKKYFAKLPPDEELFGYNPR